MKRAVEKGGGFSSLLFKKSWNLPGESRISNSLKNLSLTERWIFSILIFLIVVSSVSIFFRVNDLLTVRVPAQGGTLVEGIIGSPRFINPLLTLPNSDADRDLTFLVYSGLLKSLTDGQLIPDLAESYKISGDGLTYTFTLRENARFHDGKKVTTDDVLFTITQAQNPDLRSPRRSNWEGVEVKVVNEREISFVLSQPYSPFLENMTLGILPKHLWSDLSAEEFAFSFLNTEPIGSGPYKISDVKRDSNNLPTQYTLTAFKDHISGKPFLKKIVFKFYSNEDELVKAFEKDQIESVYAISPASLEKIKNEGKKIEIKTTILPRIFGLFFNQNQNSLFSDKIVREALDLALDKEKLINEVLSGYGIVIDSPVPFSFSYLAGFSSEDFKPTGQLDTANEKIQKAAEMLEKDGWILKEGAKFRTKKIGSETKELKFAISTSDVEDLKSSAEILKREWAKIGAEVEVLVFDANGDLSQNVIRPRKYDALLFGISIGRDLDLFPFWHSSQRNDPGFNISMYVNKSTDKILEDARTIQNKTQRLEKYKSFGKEVIKDSPAIFIYSPEFIYIVPPKIKNISLDFITSPSDRFTNVEDWYVETNKVWKLFVK